MNIIKFKDHIRLNDPLFNTYLKGKYAYWIQMRYVVPFDFITRDQYVAFENDIEGLIGWRKRGCAKPEVNYWDIYSSNLEAYVDVDETESANNIIPFSRHNSFTTDDDLTLDEVKKFRTWLANACLDFDRNDNGKQKYQFYTEEFTDILEYYAKGMHDKTTKMLARIPVEFGVDVLNIKGSSCTVCGDGQNLYNMKSGLCDPLSTYRKFVYSEMVKKFGDTDFWADFPDIFLLEFKQYIDNIIRLDLPLATSEYTSVFKDCACQSNPEQIFATETLKRLSTSLGYMIDGEVQGNKNFISKAFMDWATSLYENMEWA